MPENPTITNPLQTFDGWMKDVNAILFAKYGLLTNDLPDQLYANWYEDGTSPAEAARRTYKLARE